MFNTSDTFPYIGLRPFTEEDSLYFKGRDEQIHQLTALLEANKFLMVTGASGDGKSSLVYAGVIQNARAGFFKARYTNWVIADFRPERTPLQNLSKTISRNLRIGNEDSVEVELRRGFSSLADIYTSSSLYIDEQNDEPLKGNNDQRENLSRNAANLLIVADQFEEFFTNPENYYRNSPSADSQTVINLLLETARIAIEKDLPIYIVCTMRSDYIGQCASFRGLPEFIGLSQFFVPRLKRKELVEVIKEPALLHGDRISNRLVERVIYDLGEGIDQLPVLEHAMNEVWIQAKERNEELDLIHYAMAGGMSPEELPGEARQPFREWFDSLPSKLQEAYQRPGLSQIIDAHANKLYLSAADHYNQKYDSTISSADAQLIIKVTFTCLTKMDEGRAVRNRMTLQEITDILARTDLSYEVVGRVLNIFREPGNTFLRPYITDDPESHHLKPDTILDITHESLIRNWELLTNWAKEEYDHLNVYLDFKKQMDRWLVSNKSKGFLLPIGPLTFFEDWHNKLNPNKHWVNRYLDPGLDKESRLREGHQIILDTKEFLNRSARKVRVTRLVVKYGAAKIAAAFGIIFIIGMCGFYYTDARKKENANVIEKILGEGKDLVIKNKGIMDRYRTLFIILSEFLHPGSFKEILNTMPDEEKATSIATMHLELIWASTEANPAIRSQSLYYLDSIIQSEPLKTDDPASMMHKLKAMDLLLTPALFLLHSHQDEQMQNIVKRSLQDVGKVVKLSLTQDFKSQSLDIAALNTGIEYALHYKILCEEDIRAILSGISPFEGSSGQKHFSEYFPAGKFIMYSGREEINNLGGYQQLAYLYASLGNVQKVEMCVDSLFKLHPDYPSFRNNIFNITNYFITYGQEKNVENLISWYCHSQKITQSEFYERWLNQDGVVSFEFLMIKMVGANHNPNLDLSDIPSIQKVFDLYHDIILKEYKNADALNFKLALYYKHRGALLSRIYKEEEQILQPVSMDYLFEKAVEHYRKVSPSYLDQVTEITVRQNNSIVQQKISRKDLFLYPDHFQKGLNLREYSTKYFTDKYINFLLNRGYFSSLYRTPNDLDLINTWLSNYYEKKSLSDIMNFAPPLEEQMLVRIDSLLSGNPAAAGLNNNLARLLLIEYCQQNNHYDRIEQYYKKLEPERITENMKGSLVSDDDLFYLTIRAAGYIAREGKTDEAIRIARVFPNRANRTKVYSMTARELLVNKNAHQEQAFILLDSAICELNRIRDFEFGTDRNAGPNDPRKALALALSWLGGEEMHKLAGNYVEQIPISRQDDMIERWVEGSAGSGQYYMAYNSIPEISSPAMRLNYYNRMLLQESVRRSMDKDWRAAIEARLKVYKWEFLQYEIDLF
jgi:hypothetical protein